MTNLWYLIAAYLVLWIALFVYFYWINGAIRSIRGEANELEQRVRILEKDLQSGHDRQTAASLQ